MHKNLSEISMVLLLITLSTVLFVFNACETFGKKSSEGLLNDNSAPSILNHRDHLYVKTWPEPFADTMQLRFFIQSESGHTLNFVGQKSGAIYKFKVEIPSDKFTGNVLMGFSVSEPGLLSSKLQSVVNLATKDLTQHMRDQFRQFRQITVFKQEKNRSLKIHQGETDLPKPTLRKWELRFAHNIQNSRSETSQSEIVIRGENESSDLIIPGQIFLHTGLWLESSFRPPLSESIKLKVVTFDNPKVTFCSERIFPQGAPPTPSLTLLKCR